MRYSVRATAVFLLIPLSGCSLADAPTTAPNFAVAASAWFLTNLSAGETHSCATATPVPTGAPQSMCWGDNRVGAVGKGSASPTTVTTPTLVSNSVLLYPPSAGMGSPASSCAIKHDHDPNRYTAWCWGSNSSGKLGTTAVQLGGAQFAPIAVEGGIQFVQVSVGNDHACAIGLTGLGYCWGKGFYGQLGNGSNIDRRTPVPVSGNFTWQGIYAGGDFSCGIVKVTHQVYCWGRNNLGQLGTGNNTQQNRPTTSVGTFAVVTPGRDHACALTALPSGKVYCWGSNSSYQLGLNEGGLHLLFYNRASQVDYPNNYIRVGAGVNHSCGIRYGGAAYCWGTNEYGQRGSANFLPQSVLPTPVVTSGLFIDLAVGAYHNVVRQNDLRVFAWGRNDRGQLGDGTTTPRDRVWPVLVP